MAKACAYLYRQCCFIDGFGEFGEFGEFGLRPFSLMLYTSTLTLGLYS